MQEPLAYGNTAQIETCTDKGIVWSAVLGGAVVIVAFSFLLFLLVAAFGFESMSPWHQHSGKTFAISGALALIVVQWLSASLGGYLTGRMRTKWTGAHTHEVFFRDTVHGLLAWAVAAVASFVLVAGMSMHHPMGNHSMSENGGMHGPMREDLYRLFSAGNPSQHELSVQDRDNASYILDKAVAEDKLSTEDKSYLTQLVMQQTNVSNADAEARVNAVIAADKKVADDVRKAAAASSLFLFFSMLIAAFVACVASALGGAHRDVHYYTGSFDERRVN